MDVLRNIFTFTNTTYFVVHQCDICPLSRKIRFPFPISDSRADGSFHLVHMDVWDNIKLLLTIERNTFLLWLMTIQDGHKLSY